MEINSFLLKKYALVPKLSNFHICFEKKSPQLNISALKKLISNFYPNFKKWVERRWQWRWRWWWKIFHGEMLRKWNDIVPTYVEATKKNWATFPMLNFSQWTPTLGVSLKWNDQKRPKIAHFVIFRHIGGVQKNVDLKI